MKILCTFSCSYGDILWSLPAARELAKQCDSGQVDFATMRKSASIIPLLKSQSYIENAFVIDEWVLTGEPFGGQPWNTPDFPGREKYDRVVDLTYREHPHTMRLAQWIARDAGVRLPEPIAPFIEVGGMNDWQASAETHHARTVAIGFSNPWGWDVKMAFYESLKKLLPKDFNFVETKEFSWMQAAAIIKNSLCFVGCRSSNYVLANGVAQRVIVFEPHPARVGPVFDWPFSGEHQMDTRNPCAAAEVACALIRNWAAEEEEAV